jgi:transcriptional regulator with XRE-family HTH domain
MIHESLKEYLEHRRIPDKEFAKKLGISIPYVSMLKRGQRRPGVDLARKIERITGIPFRRLLLPDENSKIKNFVLK